MTLSCLRRNIPAPDRATNSPKAAQLGTERAGPQRWQSRQRAASRRSSGAIAQSHRAVPEPYIAPPLFSPDSVPESSAATAADPPATPPPTSACPAESLKSVPHAYFRGTAALLSPSGKTPRPVRRCPSGCPVSSLPAALATYRETSPSPSPARSPAAHWLQAPPVPSSSRSQSQES